MNMWEVISFVIIFGFCGHVVVSSFYDIDWKTLKVTRRAERNISLAITGSGIAVLIAVLKVLLWLGYI